MLSLSKRNTQVCIFLPFLKFGKERHIQFSFFMPVSLSFQLHLFLTLCNVQKNKHTTCTQANLNKTGLTCNKHIVDKK